jgi:hypothetical protein
MATDGSEPRVFTEQELWTKMTTALTGSTPAIRLIGEQMAQMALEARDAVNHYVSRGSRDVRWFYRIGGWSYGGLSAVVTAAVGGAVLGFNEWPAWTRYSIATVALVAAFIGALRPSDYLARDLRRKDLYQAFHRKTWQYILITLPKATEDAASAKLEEMSKALDDIKGVSLHSVTPAAQQTTTPKQSATT